MISKDISSISEWTPTEKKIQQGRWQILITNGYIELWMINAHYVWLVGNPAFKTIPQGYGIHHLDYNPLNDDISNLALIHKNYHLSYHAKNIEIKTPVKLVDLQNSGIPNKKPRSIYNKSSKRWNLEYYDKGIKRICSYQGIGFKTKEEAEKAIEKIFPFCEWDENRYLKK